MKTTNGRINGVAARDKESGKDRENYHMGWDRIFGNKAILNKGQLQDNDK